MSCLRAVWADEGWPVFTLSVFFLVFFLFPPHPHRTLPSTQTLIYQISEKVGPFHFLPIYSSPVDGMYPSVGTSGLGQLPHALSSYACPLISLCLSLLGQLTGRQDLGWVGRPSALHASAACFPDAPCVLHVPLAGLPCWSGRAGKLHGTSSTHSLSLGRTSCLPWVVLRSGWGC